MKKISALLLALAMILALFAGCGGGTQSTTPPPSETGGATDPGTEPTAAPTQDPDSPYNYAIGTFEWDENGLPAEPYEYELPLTTTDEVLTFWTTCYTPNVIPEEGYGSLPYQAGIRERTGVNIEYEIVSFTAMSEQFSVRLAADDLPDMMASASLYYPDTIPEMVDDEYGHFVNLYDYRDYMPAYLYTINSLEDPAQWTERHDSMFYDDTTIYGFGTIVENPMPGQGYVARLDWLRDLGLDPMEINTYAEAHDMLTLFKTELGVDYPMEMFKSIELTAGNFAGGYDTYAYVVDGALPYTRQNNGQIEFTLTTDDDLAFMTMLNQWYTEGLIDPGWASYASTLDMQDMINTGRTGYFPENPSVLPDYEASTDDPDCEWGALPKLRQTEDQVFSFGGKISTAVGGGTSIAKTCPNIELAVTWCDWFYTDSGAFYASYGPEGVTWEYNEDGEIRLTDFIMNNPIGAAWALCVYALNGLCGDPGRLFHVRSMAYEGGDRFLNMMLMWKEDAQGGNYDGAFDVPSTIKYTKEQTETINEYATDVSTYVQENYLAFVDGSKPLSEWDAYVAGLETMGLDVCREVHQEAYDTYLAEHAD